MGIYYVIIASVVIGGVLVHNGKVFPRVLNRTHEMREVRKHLPRPIENNPQAPPSESALLSVQRQLATTLSIDEGRILIISVQARDWPNSCLGLERPGEFCAPVITPGYRMTLRFNYIDYNFHTNIDGTAIRQEL